MAMTIATCKDDLKRIFKGNPHQSTAMWGPPGLGKSSILQQISEEFDWGITDIRLSQFGPDEFRGIPMPDKNGETCKWLRPNFLPTHGSIDPLTGQAYKFPHILVLDEFSCAAIPVRVASLQLINDRRLDTWKAPDDMVIVLAGNRPEDMADVEALSAPIKTRLLNFTIEPSLKDFKEYVKDKIAPQIIAFLEFRPELLLKLDADAVTMPTPRTWVMLSKTLLGCLGEDWSKTSTKDKRFISDISIGAVGEAAATEFVAYWDVFARVNVKEIIEEGKIPDDFGKMGLDVKYATLYAVLYHCNKASFNQKIVKNLLLFVEKLPPEFRMQFLMDVKQTFIDKAMEIDEDKFKPIVRNILTLLQQT